MHDINRHNNLNEIYYRLEKLEEKTKFIHNMLLNIFIFIIILTFYVIILSYI